MPNPFDRGGSRQKSDMNDNEPKDDFIEAETVNTPSDGQSPPSLPERSASEKEPVALPSHEIEVVDVEQVEMMPVLLHPESLRAAQPTEKLAGTDRQPEILAAHPSAVKKKYALFDFVLIGFGLVIAAAIGSLGAGIEHVVTGWFPEYQWIGGFVGGCVSACGGMIASVFFLNALSKFLYNRDTDRWKRNKEYPKTWHAVLLLIFAIIEPSALIVVMTLGAIGGGIGYWASMNLTQLWTAVVIAVAIPIAAGAIALLLIYDFADGGSV